MALRIKVNSLDILFSSYIRKRDGKCRKCGRTEGKLECAHWKRSINALRYDDKSCFTLCFFHHQELDHDKTAKTKFWRKQMGKREFDLMLGREREHWRISEGDKVILKKHFQTLIEELDERG